MANKHEKLRELCGFQHWLGTNYTTLPTDSGQMTDRARKYLKHLNSLALGKPEPLAKNKQTENICDENDKKTICNNQLSHECCNKHHKKI